MSSMGYGMYGYNTLNPNGETAQLPICSLVNMPVQTIANPIYFTEFNDEYGMVVPNQGASAGTYSAIRTPVSGVYEVELAVDFLSTAASSACQAAVYCDKQTSFTAAGLFAAGQGNNYLIGTPTQVTLTGGGVGCTMYWRRVLFLEKDCYISMVSSLSGGTVTTLPAQPNARFTIRCVSFENSNKFSNQT